MSPRGRRLTRRRLRELAPMVALSLASLLVCLGVLEVLLRVAPSVLGPEFANGVRSRYALGPEGIYYPGQDCDGLPVYLMKPNFEAEMYYNGYIWQHRTDSYGFRNAGEREQADVVLVGDSMVYGHGLEIGDTIGAHLERMTGLAVANLGRQGDYAVKEAFSLGQHISWLRPAYVFYFFSENDILDVYIFLDEAEMQDYLARPVEAVDDCRGDERPVAPASDGSRRRGGLYLKKVWEWQQFQRFLRTELERTAEAMVDGESQGWRVTKAALPRMDHTTTLYGAELFIVPITPTTSEAEEILRRFAERHSIAFVDTRRIDESEPSLFLPRDPHVSGEGANALARLVAAAIRSTTAPTVGP